MIKDREQWTASIRDVSLLPNSPIQQKNGKWKIGERQAVWKALGPRIFDEYLDRFKKVAVEALTERDPQFKLEPDQRFVASLHGKVLKHSSSLRTGLAETLALLGSFPEYLTSCSQGKAEYTARFAVSAILKDADWELWASLNDVLPLLAEAAPREFLDAVENALNSDPCPFDSIFAQERSGIGGGNYMTGSLWALETLAWDGEYLTRVVIILGELAARDPGGNWVNRPANSLWTILLPWFPQTAAPIAKRLAAVKTLQIELPDVAWKLLLNLLPQAQQSSSTSHKPAWRKLIPEDWSEGVTNREYWDQIAAYAELAVGVAKEDILKLTSLIGSISKLPPHSRDELLAHLRSDKIASMSEENRLPLWTKLIELISMHKKFAGADWAMKAGAVDEIAAVAETLAPQSPIHRHQRLFTERDFDLYEERDNFEEQREKLEHRRRDAVSEVYSLGGMHAILELANGVKSPMRVGSAFGVIASRADESQILPTLLRSDTVAVSQFAAGFVWGRFRGVGWEWVDSIDTSNWTASEKAQMLAYLPFTADTWKRSAQLLLQDESLYWSMANANPYEAQEGLDLATTRLLDVGRVREAIECIERIAYERRPLDSKLAIRALEAVPSSPVAGHPLDGHAIVQIIKALQDSPNTNSDELFKIEWRFLPLLDEDSGTSPKLLDQRLADDPAFFCEVIRIVFRSENVDGTAKEPTEHQQSIATNAYRLLDRWKTPPGSQNDGTFDGDALNAWLDTVKASCAESGHLKVALQRVGHVLFYSPPDPDGLWLHRSVALVLNGRDAGQIRNGFTVEIFNSRGVHFVDPQGGPERELASDYRRRAEEVELSGYHRLANSLREVAASYDREAEQLASRALLEE